MTQRKKGVRSHRHSGPPECRERELASEAVLGFSRAGERAEGLRGRARLRVCPACWRAGPWTHPCCSLYRNRTGETLRACLVRADVRSSGGHGRAWSRGFAAALAPAHGSWWRGAVEWAAVGHTRDGTRHVRRLRYTCARQPTPDRPPRSDATHLDGSRLGPGTYRNRCPLLDLCAVKKNETPSPRCTRRYIERYIPYLPNQSAINLIETADTAPARRPNCEQTRDMRCACGM